MAFHLAHPSLSLNGRKKGKVKFKSAEAKRAYEEQAQSWKILKEKHGVNAEKKKRSSALSAATLSTSDTLGIPEGRNTTKNIKSLGKDNGVAVLQPRKVYTGSEILGISVIHKSCLQPVFNKQAAKDAASMRR